MATQTGFLHKMFLFLNTFNINFPPNMTDTVAV